MESNLSEFLQVHPSECKTKKLGTFIQLSDFISCSFGRPSECPKLYGKKSDFRMNVRIFCFDIRTDGWTQFCPLPPLLLVKINCILNVHYFDLFLLKITVNPKGLFFHHVFAQFWGINSVTGFILRESIGCEFIFTFMDEFINIHTNCPLAMAHLILVKCSITDLHKNLNRRSFAFPQWTPLTTIKMYR